MKDLCHGKATWMGTGWVVIQTWAVGLPSVHGKALLWCQQTWLRLRSAISAILYVMSHGLGRPSATSNWQCGLVPKVVRTVWVWLDTVPASMGGKGRGGILGHSNGRGTNGFERQQHDSSYIYFCVFLLLQDTNACRPAFVTALCAPD